MWVVTLTLAKKANLSTSVAVKVSRYDVTARAELEPETEQVNAFYESMENGS